MSQDPIRLLGGFNLYGYALNPIMWIDKLGLNPRKSCPVTAYSRQEVIQKVSYIVNLYQSQIKNIAPDARVGLRGSLVTGKRSNGTSWNQTESDIDAWIASETLFNENNRYPSELKGIEQSINAKINLSLPCLGNGKKLFSFKTQRARFPENAKRYNEPIIKIF